MVQVERHYKYLSDVHPQRNTFNKTRAPITLMDLHSFFLFSSRNNNLSPDASREVICGMKRTRRDHVAASSFLTSDRRENRKCHDPSIGGQSSGKRPHCMSATKRKIQKSSMPLPVLIFFLRLLAANAQNIFPLSHHQQRKGYSNDHYFSGKEWLSLPLLSPSPSSQPSSLFERVHLPDRAPSLTGKSANDLAELESHLRLRTYRILQTEQQCTLSMAVRDSNRDDLLSQSEFVSFLNQLFGNQYESTPFLSLPCALQETFDEYADSGTSSINVQGTKPGQTPSAEQAERISTLCAQVISIVDSNPESGPCEGDSTGGAPVASPGGEGDLDCTGTIARAQCNTALAISDLNRNGIMDSSEYVRFVNRLSTNAYQNSEFSLLPGNIQSAFEKFATDDAIDLTGTLSGQTATAAQNALLDSFCCEADLAIADPGQPVASPTTPPSDSGGDGLDCTGTISQTQCNTALSIADSNRDSALNEAEYVRFVNRLSDNAYNGMAFTALPAGLQSNFEKFAVTDGQIDVNGSKPGETPTSAQADVLAALCCETDLAIGTSDAGGTPTEPSPSPPTASAPPTYDPLVCRAAMASSDFNRDDGLNEDEYVRFLNRLTQNQFQGVAFSALSESLQTTFNDNAQDSVLNIFGTKPGQTANTAQSEFLDNLCVETSIAIQSSGANGPQPTVSPGGNPTAAPQPGGGEPVPPTVYPDDLCRTAMASSDLNRDGYLNQEEYVRFLNRLTLNEFANATFDTLKTPLKQTYEKLIGDTGEIWIFGSKPGEDGTEEQEAFVLNICLEVSIAMNQTGEVPSPTKSPSADPPTAPAPTLPPGIAEVFNSFITSNTREFKAATLQTGVDREGLDTAYGLFAKRSMDSISKAERRLSQLRGRRLATSFVDGTDEIYLLLDSDCPEGSTSDETCQTVFAKFRVKIDEEDPDQISEEFSAATQKSISDGLLQAVLTEVDQRNSLRIVEASFPISSTLPPTAAPVATEQPVQPPRPSGGGGGGKDDDGKGSSVGGIVGGIVGAIALCAFIGWASTKCSGKGSKGLKDDDDGGRGDDDASDGEKENGFGKDKDDTGKGSNDFGFGDKPEQNPGDTKNVFGFGKKNKQGSDKDLNAFGADGGNDDAFGDDNDNLELFAFDEPSVVKGGGDGQDGSVAEKDNAFGGDSGWGNTTNGAAGFFGSDGGWGAPGGGSGGGDNFFGAPGFDNAEPKDSESRSGSGSGSEEGSYTTSEDSTFESGNADEGDEREGSEAYSRSSADEGSSYESGSKSARDDGNWDGIAEGADSFEDNGSSLESSSKRSSMKDTSMTDDEDGSFSGSESNSGSVSGSGSGSTETTRTDEREKRAEYHAQVDALVRLVLPDEVEKVDAMMEQFKGREAELVSTLQTMQERSATQRARAAVHKSKSRPQRGEDGVFALSSGIAGGAEGSAAGTAAIAAASLPIPAAGMFDNGAGAFGADGFGNEDAFGAPEAQQAYEDEEEGSFYDEDEGSQSHSGSGSRSDSRSGSQSYYSGEGEERSFTEGSRSRGSQSGSQSYYSEEGSRSRISGEEGSRVSGSGGSRSGASRSGEEGSRSHTGSRSQSQYSGEEGSGSGSRSNFSGEDGGSRSHYSGEEDGSRSYYSGDEGSQGSRSYDSREGESQSQGSRSYYSGEEGEEGSYNSGEDDDEGSFSDEGEE